MYNLTLVDQRPQRDETLRAALNLSISSAKNNKCEIWLLAPSVEIEDTVLEDILGAPLTKVFRKTKKIVYEEVTFHLISPHFPPSFVEGVLLSINTGQKSFDLIDKYLKFHNLLHDVVVHVAIDTDPALQQWLVGKTVIHY